MIITTVWIDAIIVPLFAIAPMCTCSGRWERLNFCADRSERGAFSYRVSLIPDALQGG